MSTSKSSLLLIDVQNDFLPPSGSLAVEDGTSILPIIQGLLKEEWLASVWDVVVASQDWHPHTHISFSSHHKHPHARPFTTVRVPRDVLGEHVDIHLADDNNDNDNDEDEQRLSDPRRGYKMMQGVDDGQVDLNLWPDHCIENTRGAEIEQDVKTALKPWHRAGKFALVRKGTSTDTEAFSAFSGKMVPLDSPETDKALNMVEAITDQPHDHADAEEQDGQQGLADFLIELGINKICIVGLATDFCVAQTALAAINRESSPFSVYLYEPAIRGVGKSSCEKALRVCQNRGIKVLRTEQELKDVFGDQSM